MTDIRKIKTSADTSLFCPVCGKPIIGMDPSDEYCNHVVFLYVLGVGICHTHPSYDWVVNSTYEDLENGKIKGFTKTLRKRITKPSILILDMDHRVVAPEYRNFIYTLGIDFLPELDDSEVI